MKKETEFRAVNPRLARLVLVRKLGRLRRCADVVQTMIALVDEAPTPKRCDVILEMVGRLECWDICEEVYEGGDK